MSRALARLAVLLALLAAIPIAEARQSTGKAPAPLLAASRSAMAGSLLSVSVGAAPAGARLAIARPEQAADSAILVLPAAANGITPLPTPGEAGHYEIRLTRDEAGGIAILARQPLETTPASATLNAPARVGRGQNLPVRGIGPNGEQDRVTLVRPDAPPEALGPSFFPSENVEATLEAPDEPGSYELRYVMNAPLAEGRVLATRPLLVD